MKRARSSITVPILSGVLSAWLVVPTHASIDSALPESTNLVSRSTLGEEANTSSFPSAIDDDGRFVLFYSDATNLVQDDSNATFDVFLRDRDSDEDEVFDEEDFVSTSRVSVGFGGAEGNGFSFGGDVSDDGRFASFVSVATNFILGDEEFSNDVFVRDLVSGVTEVVNLTDSESRAGGISNGGAMSSDANSILFVSTDPALTGGGALVGEQVFVRDREAGTTTQASVGEDGTPAALPSLGGTISGDGRHVLFSTLAEDLVSGDTSGTLDVFVRDLVEQTTTRINVDDDGVRLQDGGFGSTPQDISSDGRFVTFRTVAQHGDTVWVHDRDADEDGVFDEAGEIAVQRGDRRADGDFFFDTGELITANGGGWTSDDGRLILFDSQKKVTSSGFLRSAFVHDRDADADGAFDEPAALELMTIDSGSLPLASEISAEISNDGRHALWYSWNTPVTFKRQVFVSDVVPRPFARVSPGFVRDNQWFLTNNFDETANYRPVAYGNGDETKVAGDWNGDGTTDIGVVRENLWLLSRDHDVKAEIQCRFGLASDKKIVGDWDGDGDWTPGIIRGNVWHLSDDCDGDAEHVLAYGSSTDKPLTGDWDGNGSVTPGVVRGNVWFLLDGLTSAPADHVFAYGSSTDKKLAGDWDGDGDWTPGVVRGVLWFLRNDNSAGPADHVFNFGFGGQDTVLAGDWDDFPD